MVDLSSLGAGKEGKEKNKKVSSLIYYIENTSFRNDALSSFFNPRSLFHSKQGLAIPAGWLNKGYAMRK